MGRDERRARAPRRLSADRREVGGVALLRDHLAAGNHVVGDAEDVEAATAVQVDDLLKRQVAVAPCRVGVELAEKRSLHARSGERVMPAS
jgi:hypothetical protein